MTRSIRLTIAPATATMCGHEDGDHCMHQRFGSQATSCSVFHVTLKSPGPPRTYWRAPECIAAEDLALR